MASSRHRKKRFDSKSRTDSKHRSDSKEKETKKNEVSKVARPSKDFFFEESTPSLVDPVNLPMKKKGVGKGKSSEPPASSRGRSKSPGTNDPSSASESSSEGTESSLRVGRYYSFKSQVRRRLGAIETDLFLLQIKMDQLCLHMRGGPRPSSQIRRFPH